jgi:hypothetical protein
MNHVTAKSGRGKIHRAGQETGKLTPECQSRTSSTEYVPSLLALNCRKCVNNLVRPSAPKPRRRSA